MRILAGTSGFSYPAWKGSFYPADLANGKMLAYYGARFPTVEINNTFYRLPKESVVRGWGAEVGDQFQFVLKASRRITHMSRLKGGDDGLPYLLETAGALGAKLGPILYQLPPNMKVDLPRLVAFLERIPADRRTVLELRNPSWFIEPVYEALRARGAALCASDRDGEEDEAPVVATAGFGYLRLRRAAYTDHELAAWAAKVRAQPWQEAFVFFKHEDEGTAPMLAAKLMALP